MAGGEKGGEWNGVGTMTGITVVENGRTTPTSDDNDPRIVGHGMSDIANFDGDELRPNLDGGGKDGGGGGSGDATDGLPVVTSYGRSRSGRSAPTPIPVSMYSNKLGSAAQDGFNLVASVRKNGVGPSARTTATTKKSSSWGEDDGRRRNKKEAATLDGDDGDIAGSLGGDMADTILGRLGEGAKRGSNNGGFGGGVAAMIAPSSSSSSSSSSRHPSPSSMAMIPSKVQLAMEASTDTTDVNLPARDDEVIEVDDAGLMLLQNQQRQQKQPVVVEKKTKKKKKLLKGLSFKPGKSRSSSSKSSNNNNASSPSRKSQPPPKSPSKKRAKSLGKLRKSSSATAKTTASVTKDANDADAGALTASQLVDARKWKATYDANSKKPYYYHKETKEVRWEKPPGYDEVNAIDENDQAQSGAVIISSRSGDGTTGGSSGQQPTIVAPSTRLNNNSGTGKRGLIAIGRKKGGKNNASSAKNNSGVVDHPKAEKGNAAEVRGNDATGNDDDAQYWRATLDAPTGKTYYYNKKTKAVSWTKPPGFDDGSGGGAEEGAKNGKEGDSGVDKQKKNWSKKEKKVEKAAPSEEKVGRLSPVANEIPTEKNTVAAGAENDADANAAHAERDEFDKYWRDTLDPISGKTYYFNKKTKTVTWTKPEGFKEKEPKAKKTEEKQPAEETAAEVDVADEEGEAARKTAVVAKDPDGYLASAADENATSVEEAIEEMSEVKDSADAKIVEKSVPQQPARAPIRKHDAPFDEPNAPDAPFDEPKSLAPSSPRRAHFEQRTNPPRKNEEGKDEFEQCENQEHHLTFDLSEHDAKASAAPLLYGRVKSLKSIDFDGQCRQRTFASAMTEETKKAANLATGSTAGGYKDSFHISKLDDSATLESCSLNNASVDCSEIFEPFDDAIAAGGQGGDFADDEPPRMNVEGIQPPSETVTKRDELKSQLPQLPATPTGRSVKNNGGHKDNPKSSRNPSNDNIVHTKQTGQTGDSSVENEMRYEEEKGVPEQENMWNEDDEVSALSGIGNEKERAGGRRWRGQGSEKHREKHRRGGEKGRVRKSLDPRPLGKSRSGSKGKESHQKSRGKVNSNDNKAKEWTQQELDSFIAKNDWGSVSKYINEMRISKKNKNSDQIATREEPSVREIQERIEYNRTLERESSHPKKRFGARSQVQHDEVSQGSTDRGDDQSESIWQSLSSGSDKSSEGASSGRYYRQSESHYQQQRQQQQRRREM